MNNHGKTQTIPSIPTTTNVTRQPNARKSAGIRIGATIEPIEAAPPKIPCAKARSFCGNHSALDFVVPGHGPASPRPSRTRKNVNDLSPVDNEANASAPPHNKADKVKPLRVPILS